MNGPHSFLLALLFFISSILAMESNLEHTSFSTIEPYAVTKVGEYVAIKGISPNDCITLYGMQGRKERQFNPPERKKFADQLISCKPEELIVPDSYGTAVYLLNIPHGQIIREFSTDPSTPVKDMSLTCGQDGKQLICSKRHSLLQQQTFIFDINAGKQMQYWPYAFDGLDQLGSLGVRFDEDYQQARSFYAQTERQIQTFSTKVDGAVNSFSLLCTPNAKHLIAQQDYTDNGWQTVYSIFDTESGKLLTTMPKEDVSSSSNFFCSSDGRYFIKLDYSTSGVVKIFDLNSGQLKKTLSIESGFVPDDLWMSEDNKELIVASFKGEPNSQKKSKLPKQKIAVPSCDEKPYEITLYKKLMSSIFLAHHTHQNIQSNNIGTYPEGRVDIWRNLDL